MRSFPRILALIFLLASASGCGLLLGDVKPVVEKSQAYGVVDLSKQNNDWKKLSGAAQTSDGGTASDSTASDPAVSDVAYQSEKTASIISLDSACRPTFATDNRDLRSFTDQLFMGISDVTRRDETSVTIQGSPALETTIQGRLNGEDMALKTVVVHRGPCIYDLMYVARPQHFAENLDDFSQFVASLRLKE